MRLGDLLREAGLDLADIGAPEHPGEFEPTGGIEITGVTEDSRAVTIGSLFCCVAGSSCDGHDLAPEAIAKGASAIVVERELPVSVSVPQIKVPDSRAALAKLAAAYWGRPDRRLRMVAVTGTNGKTTTAHLLSWVLSQNGLATTAIGTLSGTLTTPSAPQLQQRLAELANAGHQAVVMEATSLGLDQHRVDAIDFELGIFTNLTQDHLDYHQTMERYFEAKALLFDGDRTRLAVVNTDDQWGAKLVERVNIPVLAYSLTDATQLDMGSRGSRFVWRSEHIELPLMGEFNVMNALAAATAAAAMGVTPAGIAKALSSVPAVSGRVEQVDRGQPFSVLIDFAHTPDGLEKVLAAARGAADRSNGRVIALFGCGGDRDGGKRPLMAAAAERWADVVILTNDNPRGENPAVIANDALAGALRPELFHVELDRAAAITFAVGQGSPHDVVVIAGKGHETTQEVAGIKTPFDDRIIAGDALGELGYATQENGQ